MIDIQDKKFNIVMDEILRDGIKHIVYGNGESRQLLTNSRGLFTWGCNAIYRDFMKVDNLVSVDYKYATRYIDQTMFENKCWFSDWEVLPSEFDPSYTH